MKLWDKGYDIDKLIESFTIGKDRQLDLFLAKYDILGSLAHVKMLHAIKLLTTPEYQQINNELIALLKTIQEGHFTIEDGVEDVHSQVELMLTRKIGDAGKKVHTGRSRNDQVLVDMKLFNRDQMMEVVYFTKQLFDLLIELSETHKNSLLPGYTHTQLAMPSSFGLWFGAYAESLVDDLVLLYAAYAVNNQNPLGSGAGYGSSFPLNRQMTTDLLGFDNMHYNVIYAQMGRGKTEKAIAGAIASIAGTLSKMAADIIMFLNQHFDFVKFPENLTTGSSIMPHKKNPDVFELIRAKCNKIQSIPFEINQVINNLTSGYHRDLQIVKEIFLPAFFDIKSCISIARHMLKHIQVKQNLLDDDKYLYIFSVEEVNKEVLKGLPFREAYQKIGKAIDESTFQPDKKIYHTHEGSMGNLCNDKIVERMEAIIKVYNFEKSDKRINQLLKEA
jgi:argininosuccinate lyase